MFLTGLANAYFDYDVTRTLAYGFHFDTKSLLEMITDVAKTGADIVGLFLN